MSSAGASRNEEWQRRIDAVWSDESLSADEVIPRIARLVAELPADDPRGPYELGGAHDSAGREQEAVELYERAIALGLDGPTRAALDIQYASTLRNLGRAEEAVAVLEGSTSAPELASARGAFLALALHSAGRGDEALATALEALVPHLPRYQRSLTGYASELRRDAKAQPTST